MSVTQVDFDRPYELVEEAVEDGIGLSGASPGDRLRFCRFVEGGAAGNVLVPSVTAVEDCMVPMPETVAMLLDLPPGSTFAQGAAKVRSRWASGRAHAG